MYSPGFYREHNPLLMNSLIAEFPFATILTRGGEHISHLPFILRKSSTGENILLSHMARANPHWRELSEKGKCKVVFQGPHGYITPAWYEPKNDNVPTWNYAAVHVSGTFEIIKDNKLAFGVMDDLVNTFETQYKTNWKLPQNESTVEDLLAEIVVFQVTGLEFEGKFKMSQKQSPAERKNVIVELTKFDPNLADYMKRVVVKE